jgi:hypothetical protein
MTQTFKDIAADRFYRVKQGGVLTSSGRASHESPP